MTTNSAERKLKFAVFGAGRMGSRHARNVAFLTPRAQLVALVDPVQSVLDAAKEWLPKGVKLYKDVETCLKESDCEAVLIASATAAHAPDAISAIKAGKVSRDRWDRRGVMEGAILPRPRHHPSWSRANRQHVLVEKPISIDLETSRDVVKVAESHPEIKVMVGFSRRCEYRSHILYSSCFDPCPRAHVAFFNMHIC
jgi:myo-inositol 2-dehydrogenase/D-chiro-inositol 1-dehydrogenase